MTLPLIFLLLAQGTGDGVVRPTPALPIAFVAPRPPKWMAQEAERLRERRPLKGWRVVRRPDAIYAISEDLEEIAYARRILALADAFGQAGFAGRPVWSGDWSLDAQRALAEAIGQFQPWCVGSDGLLHDAPMILASASLRIELATPRGPQKIDLLNFGETEISRESRARARRADGKAEPTAVAGDGRPRGGGRARRSETPARMDDLV